MGVRCWVGGWQHSPCRPAAASGRGGGSVAGWGACLWKAAPPHLAGVAQLGQRGPRGCTLLWGCEYQSSRVCAVGGRLWCEEAQLVSFMISRVSCSPKTTPPSESPNPTDGVGAGREVMQEVVTLPLGGWGLAPCLEVWRHHPRGAAFSRPMAVCLEPGPAPEPLLSMLAK